MSIVLAAIEKNNHFATLTTDELFFINGGSGSGSASSGFSIPPMGGEEKKDGVQITGIDIPGTDVTIPTGVEFREGDLTVDVGPQNGGFGVTATVSIK